MGGIGITWERSEEEESVPQLDSQVSRTRSRLWESSLKVNHLFNEAT